jgi:adenosylhomocysteinase
VSGNLELGRLKIAWARAHMPVLAGIERRFAKERPFAGKRLSGVLHVEAKTCVLALALQAGGADVRLAAGNPLSTDDDAVAAVVEAGVPTWARKGETVEEYHAGIRAMLEFDPEVLIDDGADLVALAHATRTDRGPVLGSTEETTTGVTRLRAMEKAGTLRWPAIDVNDAAMKHLFDNRYGCGQSFLDGLFSSTNLLVAGRTCVVAGYGWVGKGIASRLRGVGADVIVTEVDPVRAIEARLEGFRVRPMLEAAAEADLIVTTTGNRGIVRAEHLKVIKDGCLLANMGHFDVEISKPDLAAMATHRAVVRPNVEEYRFGDGRRVYLLGDGRLINLAAGQGHPAEIMDLSFALQALSSEYLTRHGAELPPRVLPVPAELDRAVAEAAIGPLEVGLDHLTPDQIQYSHSWQEGT